ncbi:MAG: endolytic transglycosylase MltG, partial [Phormidesmis sp.]
TVEYGLGIVQTPENPLTYAQVETPNDYNTYINAGLTPTPIASPGIASLEASIDPGPTEFLYFVARYDGTHVFSRTLADHESAQARIRDRIDTQSN